MKNSFLSALLGLAAFSAADCSVIHVDHSASGANDGSSWANAHVDLQSALGSAQSGDSIWVAEGLYLPSPTDVLVSFVLPDGVTLLGGFFGSETQADSRNPDLYHTILSGDLLGDDDTINFEPNSNTVLEMINCGSQTLLDGVIIERGSSSQTTGSGLHISGGAPLVRHCTIRNNQTSTASGAGAHLGDTAARFEDCEFSDNFCHFGRGAGLNISNGNPEFLRVDFLNNQCRGGSGFGGNGAAISALTNGTIALESCRFDQNILTNISTVGSPLNQGGSLYLVGSGSVTIESCSFTNGRAHLGGAIYSTLPMDINNCLFHANVVVSYALQPWLDGGDYGGAICTNSFSPVLTVIRNSTFASNSAGEGGGVGTLQSHDVQFYNCILWGNEATGTEVKPLDPSLAGTADFHYSNVEGIFTQELNEDPPDSTNFPGCMDEDPLYVDALLGDFRISSGTPCIDAGDNSWIQAGITTDLSGGSRRLDDILSPDTGLGMAPVVDMGAYEFGNESPAPAAPRLTIDLNGTSIRLSWGPITDATVYHIYGTPTGGTEALLVSQSNTSWNMPQVDFDSSPLWTFRITAE